jgi:WD40 repeat protein
VASSLDSRIRVWDLETGRSRTIGECYGVTAMALTTPVITAGEDGTVRLWPIKSI